jgi:hypothetical protein
MTLAQWTPQLVQQRLREAFAVELRLPDSDRPHLASERLAGIAGARIPGHGELAGRS